MTYALLADSVVALHVAFVLFVVAGALLVARWPRLAWLHLPCVAWGSLVELCGWICPLTPIEGRLRRLAGDEGYVGGFLEHYADRLLYPDALTREAQMALGVGAALLNLALYTWLLRRARRMEASPQCSRP